MENCCIILSRRKLIPCIREKEPGDKSGLFAEYFKRRRALVNREQLEFDIFCARLFPEWFGIEKWARTR